MKEEWNINFDESKVAEYSLPELLKFQDGQQVETIAQWQQRRLELIELFTDHVYGIVPPKMPINITLDESSDNALDGLAKQRQYKISIETPAEPIEINLLVYLPKNTPQPGVFLGLNFFGNQTIYNDPAIKITQNWVRYSTEPCFENHQANEKSRGFYKDRWQVSKVLQAGFGLATAYYGDICPDNSDAYAETYQKIWNTSELNENSSGAVSIWAWGLMRIMDAIETFEEIDSARITVMGHSRLGKTSLWAATNDDRFAAVISNNSGCGGSALSRRNFGETIEAITDMVCYWFCPKFEKYAKNEIALPIDQHMLLSLIAPKPLLITSANEDHWADPKGEFLSACHASPAYNLFNFAGITQTEIPPVNTLIGEQLYYHIRHGGHDVKADDWNAFLKFAEIARD